MCSNPWVSRHLQYCCISEIYRHSRLFYYKNQHCITNLVITQFWLLCCLFFFDIWIMLTPLVSTSSSCTKNSCRSRLKQPPISKPTCLFDAPDCFYITWAWWRMDQAGNTNILNSIWRYLAFWPNMFSNKLIAPPFFV